MYYYIILGVTLLITLASQGYLKSVYSRTKKIKAESGMTGQEVARKILDENGLSHVKVLMTAGELTDHYDPRSKVVTLSEDIYANATVASIAVASHECGHALQDKEGYAFLRFRNSIVPLVNFASKLGYIVIVISVMASLMKLMWIGILLEAIILVFQVVTLPVEFNASHRALKQIEVLGIVKEQEHGKCKQMLTAAALTYVASVASAILEVLRLVMMARDRR